MDRKRIVELIQQEGTFLYSDDLGRDGVHAIAHLSITTYLGAPNMPPMICWRDTGQIGALAEALATLYVNTPGMKETVDGLYVMLQRGKGKPDAR